MRRLAALLRRCADRLDGDVPDPLVTPDAVQRALNERNARLIEMLRQDSPR